MITPLEDNTESESTIDLIWLNTESWSVEANVIFFDISIPPGKRNTTLPLLPIIKSLASTEIE